MLDSVSLIKICNDIQGNGFLIEQLVGIAIEALGQNAIFNIMEKADVSPAILKSTQEKLENLFAKDKPVISLDGEKLFWYDIIQRGFTDDGKGNGRLLKRGLPYAVGTKFSFLKMLFLFDYPDRQKMSSEVEYFFKKSSEPLTETPWNLNHSNNKDEVISNISIMMDLIIPAVSKISETSWKMKTSREALLTVLALKRYQKEKGQYPDDLSMLVSAGYLNQLPQDPYSNNPLIYKKDEGNFVLYSVGSNFIDDGGEPSTDSRGAQKDFQDNGDWIFWPVQ
jgi:hypothetical protein